MLPLCLAISLEYPEEDKELIKKLINSAVCNFARDPAGEACQTKLAEHIEAGNDPLYTFTINGHDYTRDELQPPVPVVPRKRKSKKVFFPSSYSFSVKTPSI